jgi:hypothetical protein|tara:strand:+ start:1375 stop:1488 length:114 start_codon:yes stop_codon:yes gene_type:complete
MKTSNLFLADKEDQEEKAPACPPRKPSVKMSKSLEAN